MYYMYIIYVYMYIYTLILYTDDLFMMMIRLKFCHRRDFLLALNWYRLVALDSYTILPNTIRIPLGIQGNQKIYFMKSGIVKEQLGNLDCSPLIPLPGSWMLQNPTCRQRSSTTRFQHEQFGDLFSRHSCIHSPTGCGCKAGTIDVSDLNSGRSDFRGVQLMHWRLDMSGDVHCGSSPVWKQSEWWRLYSGTWGRSLSAIKQKPGRNGS